MNTTQRALVFLFVLGLGFFASPVFAQEAERSEREAMYYRYLEFPSYVRGGSIEPHWMADGSSFWYAEGAPANTVIYKVDPKANTKTPFFDAARLRQTLTPTLGHEPPYKGLPFEEFTFADEGEQAVKFTVEDKEFILQLDTYTIKRLPALEEQKKDRLVPQIVRKRLSAPPVKEVLSPDRRWFAGIKDHNLWLRSTNDGRSVPITTDGIEDYEWEVDGAVWSSDSFKLALKKVDYRKVAKLPIVHWLKPTEEVEWVQSDAGRPGPMSQPELFVVDIVSKRQVRLDTGNDPDQHFYLFGWRPDGSELTFLRKSRDHKKLDLMVANPVTGATRIILTETQETFVIDWSFLWFKWLRRFTWLEDGQRFLWLSERDGWNHLYLYDLNGNLIRRLTQGDFPVVRIEAVDEKRGWVYFTAHGERQRPFDRAQDNPYDIHLYRVTLKGESFSQLTETPGQHHIRFAPLKEFFLDTHSSVDRLPMVQLRQADGTLLQTLAKANVDALKTLNWSPPEEFVVKAADGKTDLYGVLYKPHDFNPEKKYPVIEVIYAGPQLSEVPHSFTHPDGVTFHAEHGQALAQLGFIAFVVDGRGTPGRGKEFQDVAYGNIGRHEIPDHVAALKQLAEKRSYMDLNRVGIFGWSFGGYFSLRALLLAPDVYHVGIAIAPVADLYLGNGIEAYMDLPENNKEAYEYASNLRLTENLKGKLLLIHGTGDGNSPFSQTMKIVDALIRAGKPHDLLVLPEETHYFSDAATKYIQEAIRRYFQEHLKP